MENSLQAAGFINPGHQCKVTIPEGGGLEFPGPQGGLVNGTVPSFARKKDAKQYAAKCAVQWIQANRLLRGGPGQPQPQQQQQQQQQQKQQQQQQQQQKQQQQQHQQLKQQKQQGSAADSAVQKANELCRELGFTQPQYRIDPMAPGSDLFGGNLTFGHHAHTMTIDVSAIQSVENILGRKEAREQLAENLIEVLEAEIKRRHKEEQAFLNPVSSLSSSSPPQIAKGHSVPEAAEWEQHQRENP
jgi:hypothetical protein